VNVGRTLFSQVMDFVPWTSFDRIVARYGGDVRVRSLRCGEQFRIMAFAQMTYRESLRDIEACLGAQPSKLYGMGLREAVARSTLADANELRDWRIWADIAAVLVRRARKAFTCSPPSSKRNWRSILRSLLQHLVKDGNTRDVVPI